MPKVLVIPDIHLKPWMFDRASRAMAGADVAVVLGDLVDDWGRQDDRGAYAETLEAAMRFDAAYPGTLWCYGNHDYCYLHFDEGTYNSGFSDALKHFVRARLQELERAVGERYKVVHEMGGILVTDTFSTYSDGRPIGNQELILYDTETLVFSPALSS